MNLRLCLKVRNNDIYNTNSVQKSLKFQFSITSKWFLMSLWLILPLVFGPKIISMFQNEKGIINLYKCSISFQKCLTKCFSKYFLKHLAGFRTWKIICSWKTLSEEEKCSSQDSLYSNRDNHLKIKFGFKISFRNRAFHLIPSNNSEMINVFLTCNPCRPEQLFQGQNRSPHLGARITTTKYYLVLPVVHSAQSLALKILLISILKDKLVSIEEKVIFNAYSILTVFHSIKIVVF